MGFLAPWFLLLGGAAVVPILIHLMRRRIGVQVEFPAARYLARAEREHSRTLRMRNLLLMVLRVLAVVLLAAAAARPTARVGSGSTGHAPTALAIVLDNSLSTSVVQGGAPLLERFKGMVAEVLAGATREDRLWLITADGVVRAGTAAVLGAELQRVQAHSGAGNLREAVSRAASLVAAAGLPAAQIAVVTDGQRTSWLEPVAVRGDVPVMVYAPADAAPPNRAVLQAEPRPSRWTPRGALAARVLASDTVTYRMALAGRTLARGTIGPGEEAVIRAAPPERGWLAGTVEIGPDELAGDNLRHFALWIGPPPAVRATAASGPFVRSALEVLRASGRVADGSAVAIGPAEVVWSLPALLLAPAPVQLGAANRALERLGVPWRFGAPRREAAAVRGESMEGISVSLRYGLDGRPGAAVDTLAYAGGEPWIVAGPGYVLVASPLEPSATSLPVSAAFLPWLGNLLAARLHADPGAVIYAAPGAPVVKPQGVTALESAGGARSMAEGRSFAAPLAPGTYFLIQGAKRVGALVVNPEEAESRLERWSDGELGRRVSDPAARVVESRSEWTRLAFAGAARRSLVAPILVVVLLVLGAEAVAGAAGARGSR